MQVNRLFPISLDVSFPCLTVFLCRSAMIDRSIITLQASRIASLCPSVLFGSKVNLKIALSASIVLRLSAKMSSLYPFKKKTTETYTTEFDILKSSHRCLFLFDILAIPAYSIKRFLRDDDPGVSKTWEAQLAKKYEDSLFKEFAVCDLKHYKSGNVCPVMLLSLVILTQVPDCVEVAD
jgi:hypothetical protein